MKKISVTKIMILCLSLLLSSCSNEDDNYKTFEGPQEAFLFNSFTSVLEVNPTGSSFVDVVFSSTTKSNQDRLIPISISSFSNATANMYSVDLSSAIIPAGETTATLRINSGSYAALPNSGSKDLVLVFDSSLYSLSNRNNHVISIQRGCTDTRVNFNIAFDSYASEISWTLSNSSGVIATSAGYSDGLSSYNEQFCLTPGNYTFVMNDSYGDGLNSPGSFALTLTDGTVLFSGGGNFGSSVSGNFTIN
ncbi:conserved exported hypothetical protein [Flavobacterium sp. 9AF]|uniref:hypothetical protein n=1 Tax=Flavobacterium sp. 9AF TaxID=2653142 RepID=UPI0012F2DE3D|nr:hypothetical protein [Flavobacterium sp. 9AF]VXC40912.1 conserved exported hypothetical protein [Flavobacterium sp. 9AF]